MLELLKTLTTLRGISGNEHRVKTKIENLVKPYSTEISEDNLGNLIVFKKGEKTPKYKVLFSAHMDEVGFIVTSICDDGLLCFAEVGGIQSGTTLGKRVIVGENNIYGIIGAKAVHLLDDEEKNVVCKISNMRIDIGAKDKLEAEKMVALGDDITFDEPFTILGENKIAAKAIDDRAGCALLIDLLKKPLEYDCWFSFTVQEETGCAGAKTVAYAIKPDIAVVVEATTAGDIADTAKEKIVCKQGEGAVLSFMDNGTIYDGQLFKNACAWAKLEQVPYQVKQGVFGGNESRNLQTAGGGAKVMAVSLPVRYIHSASNVVDCADISAAQKLLEILAKKLCE